MWITEFVGLFNIVITLFKGEFLCYNCNKPGHLARDCKEKPRNPLYVDTRGTKITDVGSRHSQDRFHPYARGSNDRSKYDDGQSRERRFERSPPRDSRESREPREYREVRDPREIRDPRYTSYDRPAERRYPSPPPSDRRPPPEYYRGAPVPMRDYPPVQRGRSPPERPPVRYGGAMPDRRMPDPRMDNFPPRPVRGADYFMDRRMPAQTEGYRGRSPEPAFIPRPRSRSPPEHYREYRGAVPPSDPYARGRSPERIRGPIPQRGPEVRRGRSPERYPEHSVDTRRYSRSPPAQAEYRYQGSSDRFRNERRDDNDYGRGRRDSRRTPERIRNDGPESYGSGVKRPLTPESKPDDGRAQTP